MPQLFVHDILMKFLLVILFITLYSKTEQVESRNKDIKYKVTQEHLREMWFWLYKWQISW